MGTRYYVVGMRYYVVEIIMSWERDLMSRGRDIKLLEQDIFFTCPLFATVKNLGKWGKTIHHELRGWQASSLVKISIPRVRYIYPTWTLMVICYNQYHNGQW